MTAILLAAILPGLFWEEGVQTAPALKQAGIERLYVPAQQAEAWRRAGFHAVGVDAAAMAGYEKLPAPHVQWKANLASATRSPWIDANGWRFAREPGRLFYERLPNGGAALAAAEAFAYGANVILHIDPRDLESFGRMLAFFGRIGGTPMPVLANIGILDDGSETMGEVMNLLARRNLLYRIVSSPDPALDLNVRVGSPEFPKQSAEDPDQFARLVRSRLTDEKRLLRIYGSEVVLGRLNGQGARARLHLLNYGQRRIEGLRIRLRGRYKAVLHAAGLENAAIEDYLLTADATEFTIPAMLVYAVVDLERVS